MKFCFIGSGMEREAAHLEGIEIRPIARVARSRFDTLVFGGSSAGLMEAFASSFVECGGSVISVVPRWLEDTGQVFGQGELVRCANLAERKHLMFDAIDAVLCYPGGLGTWDELFDLLARRAIDAAVSALPACPPVYLYNWQQYYAPLLLQMETAVELGLIRPETLSMVRPFSSAQAFDDLLCASFPEA